MNTLQQAIQVVSKNFVNQIEPGMSMPHGATNDHDTMAYIVSRLEGRTYLNNKKEDLSPPSLSFNQH